MSECIELKETINISKNNYKQRVTLSLSPLLYTSRVQGIELYLLATSVCNLQLIIQFSRQPPRTAHGKYSR